MRQLLGALACISALACVNTSVQRLDQTIRPARSPDSVTVLLEKPQQSYTVIAVIEARARSVFDGFDDLCREMRAEAGRLGGVALMLGPGSTDSEFIFTGTAMIKSDRMRMTGEVIVFNQDE